MKKLFYILLTSSIVGLSFTVAFYCIYFAMLLLFNNNLISACLYVGTAAALLTITYKIANLISDQEKSLRYQNY